MSFLSYLTSFFATSGEPQGINESNIAPLQPSLEELTFDNVHTITSMIKGLGYDPHKMTIARDYIYRHHKEDKSWLDDSKKAHKVVSYLSQRHPIFCGIFSTITSLSDVGYTIYVTKASNPSEIDKENTLKVQQIFENLVRARPKSKDNADQYTSEPSENLEDITKPTKWYLLGRPGSPYKLSDTELFNEFRNTLLLRGSCPTHVTMSGVKNYTLKILDPDTCEFQHPVKKVKKNKKTHLVTSYDEILVRQERTVGMITEYLVIDSGICMVKTGNNPFSFTSESPLISNVESVLLLEDFLTRLLDMISVAGYPMVTWQHSPKLFAEGLTEGQKTNGRALMYAELKAFQEALKANTHTDALNYPDWIKPVILNENAAILKADFSQVVTILREMVQVSSNISATSLGSTSSGTNTASVEMLNTAKTVDALNKLVAALMVKILTYIMKLEGVTEDINVKFEFDDVQIRTDVDSYGMKTVKQTFYDNARKQGAISWELQCLKLYGTLPYSKKPVEDDTIHSVQVKDKVSTQKSALDKVAAPTGTESPKR